MKAWIYDDLPGDQRLPHKLSEDEVTIPELEKIGVIAYAGIDETRVEEIAKERVYKNRDEISVSKEGLGELYKDKIKGFFREHLHEDEEIRYIREGEGYFDLRDAADKHWIRVHVTPGDFLVVPAGIYHRFTLTSSNYVKALRLFKDEPKWIPHDRSSETDENPFRKEYLESINVAPIATVGA